MEHSTAAMRVSEAEREPVIERLKTAYAEGRLAKPELDTRLDRAMSATTRAELHATLVGLVRFVPQPAATPAPPRGARGPGDYLGAAAVHALGVLPVVCMPIQLLAWLLSGSPYVRRHAAAALNLQVTLFLLVIVTLGIGVIAYAVSWILAMVMAVVALVGGEARYPWTLRLFR